MVQVFGKRILGGVGAPDPRMSESFGAGVNTALGQREARQAMQGEAQRQRILEQKFAWEGEDRAEAKKRRAAGAASAAAAKAANITALQKLGSAQPFFRLGAQPATPGATAPVAPRGAVSLPRSMGTPVGGGSAASSSGGRISSSSDGAPAVKPPYKTYSGTEGEVPRAYITPEGWVWPGFREDGKLAYLRPDLRERPGDFAAQTTLRDLEAARAAAENEARVGLPTDSKPVGEVPGALFTPSGEIYIQAWREKRPGDFAAQATQRELAAGQPSYNLANVGLGIEAGPSGSLNIPRMQARIEELKGRIAEETRARGEGGFRMPWNVEDVDALNAEIQQIRENIVAAQMQPGTDLQSRGVLAAEGPETSASYQTKAPTVAIRGPGGAILTIPLSGPAGGPGELSRQQPAAPAAPTLTPVPAQPNLQFSAAMSAYPGTEQLTFGPRLGSAPTPTQMFLADVGRTPPGQVDLQALVAAQNSPVYDPNFSAAAEQERAVYAYMAEAARNKGDINGYMAAADKVREMETLILTQQLTVGIDEAANFNSAQRLNAVAAMVYKGANVTIIPKGNGLADVYVGDKLSQAGASLFGIQDQLMRVIDSDYRAAAVAAQSEQAKERFKTDEAIRQQVTIDTNKAQLEYDQKAQDLARAVEQEFKVGLAKLQVDTVKEALIVSGKLPGPAAEYSYQKIALSDGSEAIAAMSNGQPVAVFAVGTVEVNGRPQLVLQEIGG